LGSRGQKKKRNVGESLCAFGERTCGVGVLFFLLEWAFIRFHQKGVVELCLQQGRIGARKEFFFLIVVDEDGAVEGRACGVKVAFLGVEGTFVFFHQKGVVGLSLLRGGIGEREEFFFLKRADLGFAVFRNQQTVVRGVGRGVGGRRSIF